MSVLVNHPGFQEQRRHFCIFVISPLLYKQLGSEVDFVEQSTSV